MWPTPCSEATPNEVTQGWRIGEGFDEAKWAEINDSKDTPVEVSLQLLESLHKRWVVILKSMTQKDFEKTVTHPEWGKIRLDYMLAIYDWHCKHHLAHILSLKKRMAW